MATPKIIPRANGGGGLGMPGKGWGSIYVTDVTTGSANQGGIIELASDDGAAMGDSHRLGVIYFKGAEDTAGTLVTGARIEALTDAAWTNAENGCALYFYTTDGNASETNVLKLDSNAKATFSGAVSVGGNLTFDSVVLTGIQASGESFADNDVSLMTSAAIDDRINAAVTAEDLDVAADSGTAAVDLNSQSLTVTGGTNVTTSATGQAVTINVDDAFVKNNTRDSMVVSDFGAAPAFIIDANQPATTGAENSVGLQVDYDRIVAASGTANHNDIGIDVDVNAATLGTGTATGIDIDVEGATSGTHTVVGLDVSAGGGDSNIGVLVQTTDTHLKLQYNDDDFATVKVIDTGDLVIATTGDGTKDSDITLDADGDIKLEPATDNKILLDGVVEVDGGSVTAITTLGLDSVSITAVQTSAESFVDNNTSIMTSGAINDRFSLIAGSSNIVTTGALNSGSITSGFGNIDNGSSTLDTGVATVGSLVCTAGATFGGGTGSTGGTITTAGVATFDGAIKSTAGAVTAQNYRTIWVDAGSMVPSVTNGAAAGTEEASTNDVMNDFFAFDSSTDEYVQFKVVMPEQWDGGTVKAKFYWKPSSSTTTSHDCQWGIQATAHADGGTIDSAFGTAAVATTDVVLGTAAGRVHISLASGACTIAGSPAEGELVYFRVFRDISGDDLNEDAHLLGVNIQYKESSTASAAW